MNGRTNDPEHGLGTSPLLGPMAPGPGGHPGVRWAPRAPTFSYGSREAPGQFRAEEPAWVPPDPCARRRRQPTLPGGHFLPVS